MKEIKIGEIKNSKNETLKDYCDKLWEVAEKIDAKAKEFKNVDKFIYDILFDYSSELQQIICDLQITLDIKIKI